MKHQQNTFPSAAQMPQKTGVLTAAKEIALRSRKKTGVLSRESKAYSTEYTDEVIRQSASLFALVNEAIIAKTVDGTITLWNQAAERMFGYSAAEIVGQSTRVLFPSDRAKETEDILARTSLGERIKPFETVCLRKDGRLLDVSVAVSPLKNQTGQIIGSSKILRDLTEFNRV